MLKNKVSSATITFLFLKRVKNRKKETMCSQASKPLTKLKILKKISKQNEGNIFYKFHLLRFGQIAAAGALRLSEVEENQRRHQTLATWDLSSSSMSFTPKKRPNKHTRNPKPSPNCGSGSSSSPSPSSLGLFMEPSPDLFPSKDEFFRLVALLAIAASVAVSCNFLVGFFTRQPKPFCDDTDLIFQDSLPGLSFS